MMLDEAGFAAAVKDALKHYQEPDGLRGNPLLDCLLVTVATRDEASPDRVHALRAVLAEQCQHIATVKKTEPLARVLDATYLHPWPTQAQAAAALGLALRTYARHLAHARSLLTAWLWESELQARFKSNGLLQTNAKAIARSTISAPEVGRRIKNITKGKYRGITS